MNKLLFIPFFLFVFASFSHAQVFKVRFGGANGAEYDVTKIPAPKIFDDEIKTFEIKKEPADATPKDYSVNTLDESQPFKTDGAYHTVTFTKDVRGKSGFTIKDESRAIIGTKTVLNGPKDNKTGDQTTTDNSLKIVMPDQKTATAYLTGTLFKNQIVDIEGVGLKILNPAAKKNTKYVGTKYVHLFFDQNGNSLLHSIPIGVGRANYVVHIIYLVVKDNAQNIDYKVNQDAADIEEGTVIRGDGSLEDALHLQGKKTTDDQSVVELEWRHSETALTPSSYDVKFDIVRTGFQINENDVQAIDPVVVASRIIKMKKIYHGSIDVAVLKSKLENPTYATTASDVDPTQLVVKRTNTGSRIVASAMYTFYLSPVVLLEKLFAPEKVQNYRIEGRSFVDDHKIYERIYPCAGIGLNDRLLDNVYLGGKWEFIRGGSVFVGYHWGKVNILEVDDGFKFESSYITQASFDLKTKTKWKGNICFGLNLDMRIITNLFKTTVSSAQ